MIHKATGCGIDRYPVVSMAASTAIANSRRGDTRICRLDGIMIHSPYHPLLTARTMRKRNRLCSWVAIWFGFIGTHAGSFIVGWGNADRALFLASQKAHSRWYVDRAAGETTDAARMGRKAREVDQAKSHKNLESSPPTSNSEFLSLA
jgi:hypothetical protein